MKFKTGVIQIPKARADQVFCYAVGAMAVLNCNSVYEVAGIFNEKYIYILVLAAAAVMIAVYRNQIFQENSRKKWLLTLGLGLYQLLHMIFREGFQKWFLMKFVVILAGFCMLFLADRKGGRDFFRGILRAVSHIMLCLAAVSLILWVFGTLLHWIPATGSTSLYWGGDKIAESYLGLQFDVQTITVSGIKFYRNTGIYTEGPMYAFLLSLALAERLFLNERAKKWQVGLLIAAILTTVSATGMIAASAAVLIRVSRMLRRNKIVFWTILGICVLTASLALGFKVMQKGENSSLRIRTEDYGIILESLKDRPVFGYGYEQYDTIIYKYMDTDRNYDTGGSNGFFYPLTQGGITMFLPYLLSYVFLVRSCIRRKDWKELSFWGIYLLLFATSIVSLKLISILVIGAGFAESCRKEERNGRKYSDQYSCHTESDLAV